ncbi:hypothetical protein CEXT_496981 [Caerostris extrusa]|uniref:Uncharacterized protein n=1 Tax=Caerostris extrusa TaxID=172846 RepID=A0AAV4Y6S5_CAEEX|nr:hypothetical protein CEXT_496981 [Caerostris extrusa]
MLLKTFRLPAIYYKLVLRSSSFGWSRCYTERKNIWVKFVLVTADQSTDEEDEKLIRILHKQRQHKRTVFLNEMSQVPLSETAETPTASSSSMTQSYHFKTDTSPKSRFRSFSKF